MSSHDRRSKKQRDSADPVARHLGRLQAEVMSIFWRRESATVREVVDELNKRRPLAYTTVLTIISRLRRRGLLAREPAGRGRAFRYWPVRTREELLGDLTEELIDRLFADFGEIALARLGARIDQLDPNRQKRLRETRKR